MLSDKPDLPNPLQRQLERDFDRFAATGLPAPLESYLLSTYGLDVASSYCGIPVKNPWGKASGQLSMTEGQVSEDAQAGLGFCVLKTVIAQSPDGIQSMGAWAIPEARMVLERIRSPETGREGWTVSWKGRGWSRTFPEYLQLIRAARQIGHDTGMLIVPSCKYHLPTPDAPSWKLAEYEYTTQAIIDAYEGEGSADTPAPIEKDFSPTLAGSSLATSKPQILDWVRTVPKLMRDASGTRPIRVAIKLFNAVFDDAFQLEMIDAVAQAPSKPDAIVYANRLFDPVRTFEGQRGIAVGGPELSERNLRILSAYQRTRQERPPIEFSATGDICTGRQAVEYLLRGCSTFQMHTLFQLPASEYSMRTGTKTAKTLHLLYFHPETGFIAWIQHLVRRLGLSGTPVRLADLLDAGRHLAPRII